MYQAEYEWFETPLGQHLLFREQRYFDHAVSDVFGFNAVQVGLPQLDFLRNSRIPLRVTCAVEMSAQVRADPCSCIREPVARSAVAAACAGIQRQPTSGFARGERVLRPEGRLVLAGFNPAACGAGARAAGRRALLSRGTAAF